MRNFKTIVFLLLIVIILNGLLSPKSYSLARLSYGFFFAFIIAGLLYIAIFQSSGADLNQNSDIRITTDKDGFFRMKVFLTLITCLILANAIIGIRYFAFFNPKGFDTPHYIYALKTIYSGTFTLDLIFHPLVIFVLTPLVYVFNGDPFLIGISIPFYIGSIFTIVVFTSSRVINKSLVYSLLVTSFAVSNFLFVRLTYDLFSQTLFIALFYAVIMRFTKLSKMAVFAKSSLQNKFFLTISIVLVLMLLTDVTLSIITYIFLGIILLIRKPKILQLRTDNSMKKPALTIISLVAIIILMITISGYAQRLWDLWWRIINYELSLFKPTSGWEWIIYKESLPILILCALSVAFFVIKNGTIIEVDFVNLLALWSSYIFLLIFVTGYIQSYRFILLIPISTIAANGVYCILNEPFFLHRFWKFKKIQISHIVGVVLIVIVAAATLPSATILEYEFFPKNTSVLSDLASRYGFDSSDVTYLIHRQATESPYWYNAYLGRNVFIGNITQFLASNITTSTIIFHEDFFPLNGLTRLISEPLGTGVYRVNTSYLELPRMELFNRWTTQVKVNFTEYPMNISNFGIFGYINVTGNGAITAIFYDTNPQKLIGGITRKLARQVTFQELFLIYEGNVTANIAIEFYNSNAFIGCARFRGIGNEDMFFLTTLTNDIIIDEYRITLSGSGTNTIQTLRIKLISFGVAD
ncbi:MAG: hypothetical protein KIH09_15330 [Candidatus Freyarchaeota archaeon]|nr:hypothetical protein [Candidatus Jordarchaeia archaeon]